MPNSFSPAQIPGISARTLSTREWRNLLLLVLHQAGVALVATWRRRRQWSRLSLTSSCTSCAGSTVGSALLPPPPTDSSVVMESHSSNAVIPISSSASASASSSADSQHMNSNGEARIKVAALDEADEIYSLFVADRAPFEINIGYALRKTVDAALKRYRAQVEPPTTGGDAGVAAGAVTATFSSAAMSMTTKQVEDTLVAIRKVFDECDQAVMTLMSSDPSLDSGGKVRCCTLGEFESQSISRAIRN